jgi:hypothetical protein
MITDSAGLIQTSSGGGKFPALLLRWAALFLGVALILGFVFGLAPWLQTFELISPLTDYVRESGIEAGALYYTEVEEVGDALVNIRSSLDRPDAVTYREADGSQ